MHYIILRYEFTGKHNGTMIIKEKTYTLIHRKKLHRQKIMSKMRKMGHDKGHTERKSTVIVWRATQSQSP